MAEVSKANATGSLLTTLKTTASSELGKRLEGKNRSLSYKEWLSRNGASTDPDGIKNAATAYAKGSPDYGAAAERVSDRGLSRTGYAQYLREKNEETYRAALGKIKRQNDERESRNRNGYLSYLTQWEQQQDELMQKTLHSLAEQKVSGISDAYADALEAGLTDDRAAVVSRLAPVVGRYGTRRLGEGISGVLAVSLQAGLSGADADLLARACGISSSDAKKLRQTVETSSDGQIGRE